MAVYLAGRAAPDGLPSRQLRGPEESVIIVTGPRGCQAHGFMERILTLFARLFPCVWGPPPTLCHPLLRPSILSEGCRLAVCPLLLFWAGLSPTTLQKYDLQVSR